MAVDQNAGEVHWESASGSKIMKAVDVAAGKLLSLVATVVVSEGVIFVAAHLKELVAKTGYNSAKQFMKGMGTQFIPRGTCSYKKAKEINETYLL